MESKEPIGLLFAALVALPPPVPSAGIVERELEKEYEAQPLEEPREVPAIQIEIPNERLDLPEGVSLFVKKIQLEGNTILTPTQYEPLLTAYENQDLSIQKIYELCDLLDQLYADRGYFLARAYPPPQEVQDGVLTIHIIEGCLGSISVEGNRFYSTSFILSYFAQLGGKPLCHQDFFHQLMLLNDNHDLIVGALLQSVYVLWYEQIS